MVRDRKENPGDDPSGRAGLYTVFGLEPPKDNASASFRSAKLDKRGIFTQGIASVPAGVPRQHQDLNGSVDRKPVPDRLDCMRRNRWLLLASQPDDIVRPAGHMSLRPVNRSRALDCGILFKVHTRCGFFARSWEDGVLASAVVRTVNLSGTRPGTAS